MAKRRAALNAKSSKYLVAAGYQVDTVERTIPYSYIKKDLYGCFDLLAVGHGEVIFVQVTSKSNASSRRKKVRASAAALEIFNIPGARVELHLWFKPAHRWVLNVEEITEIAD